MFVPLTPLDFLRRAIHLYPNRTAVVDGNVRLTYQEYQHRVNRLSNSLLSLSVVESDVVSFLTFNRHQLLEAYYGVVQMGAILNPINVRMGDREIEYILKHSGSKVVFVEKQFAPLVRKLRPQLPELKQVVVVEGEPEKGEHNYEALLSQASTDPVDYQVTDENAMCEIFYTSGTTGLPKAVALSHRSLYLHALSTLTGFQIGPDDVILHIVPLFHVNGWGTPQFLTAVGGKHVMLQTVSPENICKLVQEEKITRLYGVPTVMNALLNYEHLDQYDMSSVTQIAMGGAPSSQSLIEQLEAKFKCEAIGLYGLSETSPLIANAQPKPEQRNLPAETRQAIQARTGYELIGAEIQVMRPDGTPVVPDGVEIGEIAVKSNLVMMGYYKDEEATEKVMRDGWFYTGDLAVIDEEGSVLIVDRSKDIVISGGENISTQEVEAALYSHEAVYECAVFGVPHEKWGETPHAAVVLKQGHHAEIKELIEHCRNNLGHYKCPKAIDFLDELPKSGTGKILKRVLREPFWEGREKRV